MKKKNVILQLLVVFLISLSGTLSAQVPGINSLFDEYSGQDKVSEIEMTQRMLKVIMNERGPDAIQTPVDRFKSIHIMANKTGKPYEPSLTQLKQFLEERKFERIAYLRENSEMVVFLGLPTGKKLNDDDLFSKFVLLGKEPNNKSEIIMTIEGNLTLKEALTISALMNYDLTKIIKF